MNDDRDDAPLDELRALSPEVEPPAGAEQAILRRLRAGGLVTRDREAGAAAGWRGYRFRALAAVAAIVVAFLTGRMTATPAPPDAPPAGPHFMLLLYGEADATGLTEDQKVAAYGAWARQLRAAGRSIRGEKLDESAPRLVGAPAPVTASARLTGFFIVGAADAQEAEAIARQCPHAQNGGTVVVRRIEPT